MPFMFYDWTILLILPGLLLSMWAQARVRGAYNKYEKVASREGLTGAEMARRMLQNEGIHDVAIETVQGTLTDHYNPNTLTLGLSQGVANSTSIAALGIAAHETGHVLQHRDGYSPLMVRTAAVPVANVGSNLSWVLVLVGLIFSFGPLITAGIILFSVAVFFTLITLPVEFNASKRAMAALESGGYLSADELPGAKKVLDAAALTYVAAALTAVLQLVRLLALSGRRRR